MTDATLLDVKVPQPEFMDDYDTGSNFVVPPQPKEIVNGKVKFLQFVAQVPGVDKVRTRDANGAFLKTGEGYLKAVIDGIKLPNDGGYEIFQTHIGTAQYKKYDKKTGQPIPGEYRNASPALDYFHAHGIEAKPTTPEEYESLFQATADRQFTITGDWSAYNSETQTDVARKWEDFPDEYVDQDGKVVEASVPGAVKSGRKQPFIEVGGKRFWARLSVKRYVSTV